MLWELRYQRDGHAVETLVARNQPVPEWAVNQTELLEGEQFYFDAFWSLSTERQIGMALGPIPHSAIRDYAVEAGLDSDMMVLFDVVIRSMDSAYVDWVNKQQAEARKNRGKGN